MKTRRMTEADFDEVYESVLAQDGVHQSADEYRTVFSTSWDESTESCGYVMTDGAKIVGVLGTLFSDRVIQGQNRRFCNLHTWFVRKEFRGFSLALMRPITRLSDCTITDFSPSRGVVLISRRLGFSMLDSRIRVLLPMLGRRQSDVSFSEQAEGEATLPSLSQKILDDHTDLPCSSLIVTTSTGRQCLLIYSTIRQRIPYCFLHYISDLHTFRKHSITIRHELSRRSGCRLVAAHHRTFGQFATPRSITLPVGIPQLYKSSTVAPEHIDTLYSEVLLNGWPLISTVRASIRTIAERTGLLRENERLKDRVRRLFRKG